ncbi:hypothetical protein HB4184_10405 [Pseudomonas putida]|nr:hypothetical protein HB4184_10405 [Pseudomonas putida]
MHDQEEDVDAVYLTHLFDPREPRLCGAFAFLEHRKLTVSTNASVVDYTSGGPNFPVPYRFLKNDDVQAMLIYPDGITIEPLAAGTQYTLVGAGNQSGGTLTSSYASGVLAGGGYTLRIQRVLAIVQETDLRNQGKYLAETQETALDRAAMIDQQQQEQIDRSIKAPPGSGVSGEQLVVQIFQARDQAQAAAAEAEEIATELGDLQTAVGQAQSAAQSASTSASQAAGSASQASMSASAAQTAADAAQLNAAIYPDTATGLAATSNGQYFSVVSTDSAEYLILYRNFGGSAVEQKRYPSAQMDSRTVNKGKPFPFKQMSRGGVVSAASTIFNNLVLDVKVIGSANLLEGKYFRIAFFQNESNIGGNADQGIVLEEFDASTYLSTGTATTIHNHTDAPAGIVRTGGVQTFTVTPASRIGLRFIITIDANSLPAAGLAVNALTSERDHYSWIIDPAGYVQIGGLGSSLLVNKGSVFPQRQKVRNNISSAQPAAFMSCVLDVEVIGSRVGKYYRLAYFKNGTNLLPGPDYGWMIEEIDAANYETAANPALIVVNYTDAGTPTLVRDGIQTIRLESTVVSGLQIKLTIDTSALPNYGTPIGSNQTFQAGYSYIIDPSRYTPAASGGSSGASLPMQWSLDASNNLRIAWASKSRCYRVRIAPNGVNALPNIVSVEGAAGSDLANAVWSTLSTTGSDWLPPMQIAAQASGDGGSIAFTGGAHGSNGDATGSPTARNVLFQSFADGKAISPGTSGTAELVSIQLVNELQGYNTKTLGRYVARQAFSIEVSSVSLVVTADVTPLEAVTVFTDYALQALTEGFRGTQIVLGGQNTAREPFVIGQSRSGEKSSYPNAWAVVFQEPTNGQMTLWMDKQYADGDGKYVDPAGALVRGENTGKWYLGVVLPALTGTPVGHNFAAGAGYKYRAGLSWQSNGMQPTGYDSSVAMKVQGAHTFAYGLPDASFVRVS